MRDSLMFCMDDKSCILWNGTVLSLTCDKICNTERYIRVNHCIQIVML